MTRAFLVGFVLLTAACGNKTFESLCAAQVPAPAGCDTACNPAPGGVSSCPGGYHCSADGKCDLFCTQAGGECGDGYSCTADGFCNKTGDGTGVDAAIDAPCNALHFTPTRTTPTVELLLDESSSMNRDYGGIQRMDAMRNALVDPTNGVVAKLAGQVVFGATLYTTDGGQCPFLTRQARALNNFQPIRRLLQDAAPTANTPTGASIDAVVASFNTNPPPSDSPKIIVLATDGLPDTCEDPNPPEGAGDQNDPRRIAANAATVAAARRAFDAGIRLYFLFIGQTGVAGNHAQQMANAGVGRTTGNAPYFEATNPAALTQAFETIIGNVISCDLRLENQLDPADAPSGVVTVNGTVLDYPDEWTLDADGFTIHVLGAACDMLKASANPVVDAAFPCGIIIE